MSDTDFQEITELQARYKFLSHLLDMESIKKKCKSGEPDGLELAILKYIPGLRNKTNEGCIEMQDFIGMNLKKECDWLPPIGVVDSMDAIIVALKEAGEIRITDSLNPEINGGE